MIWFWVVWALLGFATVIAVAFMLVIAFKASEHIYQKDMAALEEMKRRMGV